MKKIIYGLLIVVIVLVLLLNLSSIFNKSFLGFRTFRVASGSMEPYLKINDLIIIKKQSDYKLKDVVTYESDGAYITHRIVKKKSGKYLLKGDANNTYDDKWVSNKNIMGKLIYKFNIIGFSSPTKTFIMFFSIFLIGLVITFLIPDKK